MPRAGGQSTAVGVSFQARAIARVIIDVSQGRADFVRAELPPRADLGQQGPIKVEVDDFLVQRAARHIYYQAKSNAPGGGSWTLKKLLQEQILQKFVSQLESDPEAECCLLTPCESRLLGDLANRASDACSPTEYLANLDKKGRGVFDQACQALNIDSTAGYSLLRRCRLEIRTSEQMTQEMETLAQALFADPKSAVDSLYAMGARAMETSRCVDPAAIKEWFSERGVFAKPQVSEAELLDAIRGASSRLRRVEKDIAGVHILQDTVYAVFDWINEQDFTGSPVAAMLDQAGSGKTVAMSVLLNRLERAGYAVLGIKVDGLVFSSHDELASAIGLPAPIPSIVQSLSASGHRIAVLIDQVDALSTAMSRDSSAITVVLDLVARLATLSSVPIVLACRSFDWKYDHRLKTLRDQNPKQFALPELTDQQLGEVLGAFSLQQTDMHPLTVKVVRCPLRLRAFIDVVKAHRKEVVGWSPRANTVYTLQTLYQEFWALKMRKAESDGSTATACEKVATLLAEHMQDHEQLAAPAVIVSQLRSVVDWLISEDILAENGKILAFFHQTFFDFIFARQFVQRGGSLIEHLLSTDQGLFYRPMTRQILEYLREVHPKQYLAELKGMLQSPRIRKHLRWLTIAWLGQQRDPRPEELLFLEPFLAATDHRRRTLFHLQNNPPWFDLLTQGRFQRWLQTLPDSEVDVIIWHLQSLLPERQEDVVSLMTPYVGRSESWNNRILFCLGYFQKGWGASSAKCLQDLLRSPLTDLDQDENSLPSWGMALEHLANGLPEKACETVGIILGRYKSKWLSENVASEDGNLPYSLKSDGQGLPRAHHFTEVLEILSGKAPAELLAVVLPWTLSCMAPSCESRSDMYYKDNWRFWNYDKSHRFSPSEKLLAAIGAAARNLARKDPGRFRSFVPQMLTGGFLAMQCIVADAYLTFPKEYASDAAEFLCADDRRLRLVTVSGGNIAPNLIAACSPHWKKTEASLAEEQILAKRRQKPSGSGEYQWDDRQILGLLLAFEDEKLTDGGIGVLGQLRRKYPGYSGTPVMSGEMKRVGPPIAEDAIKRMTGDGWLGAMKKYTSCRDHSDRPIEMSGGRIELSRALRARAKEEPERFYRLALENMDDSYHPDYVDAIIGGIAEAGADVEKVEQLIAKYLPLFSKGNIRQLAWAIDKYAGKQVPDSLVHLLKEWICHAIDPEAPGNMCSQKPEAKTDDKDLLRDGMNTDRGAALWTLAAVLLKSKPPRQSEYLDVAENVADDPSPAVRAVCIKFLQYATSADPVRTCNLFRRLVGSDRELLRERGAYDSIYSILHRHSEKALWAIKGMLSDTDSAETREDGAKLACLAAFNCPLAAPLRDACMSGEVALRKGAAAVYSTNLASHEIGQECRQRLASLMNDEDHDVRTEATKFLRNLDASDLRDISDFIREWSESKSLDEGANNAAYMLEEHSVVSPELTLDVAERIVEELGSELTNIQKRHGGITYHLTPAILNVYHRSIDKGFRQRAMDLFEALEELGCP